MHTFQTETVYTPRRPRSSDQALRGDFSSNPQKPRSRIASFTATIMIALKRRSSLSRQVTRGTGEAATRNDRA